VATARRVLLGDHAIAVTLMGPSVAGSTVRTCRSCMLGLLRREEEEVRGGPNGCSGLPLKKKA
jgi:hypothetical protein